MQKEQPKRSRGRKVARVVLKTILYLFLFIVVVFLLILTPPVQKFLTGRVENYLEKKLQTQVRIESISFGLSGNISLNNIYVEDRTKDTLLAGGVVKAHLNYLKLFSNEVEIKDIELQNITAKIKRILPDTVFNYQFVVDAFAADKNKLPDTSDTAPLKLNVSDLTMDNVNLTFSDVVTGIDMFAHIGYLTTTIDSLDPYTQTYSFPTLIARNSRATMKQVKPLVQPKSMAEDVAEAQTPSAMNLAFGRIDLDKVTLKFDNDVSSFYTDLNIGKLRLDGRLLDLQNNRVHFDELTLANTTGSVRMGKDKDARLVKQQLTQEVQAEKTAGWDFRVARIRLDNNDIVFDDDNLPRQATGIDFAHLNASDLNFHVDNFVLNADSTGGKILKGSFREKSGFVLEELRGDVLYASNQSYLKDLYIKTPGTELKRSLVMEYASYDALVKNFEKTLMDIDIVDSYVQVKDILAFAPQLRTQPAFANAGDVWRINIIGSGNLDRLNFETLQFDGFSNTRLDAAGTLVGLMNPNNAGGDFTIYNLHTTQSDIAMLTGQRLSNASMNFPETIDVSGSISGNAGQFSTRLNVSSSVGFVALNGSFGNIMNPASTTYNGTVRANNLRLGYVLKQQDQIGNITGSFTFRGKGLTPEAINTRFTGNIASAGYNRYQYRNIKLQGTLRGSAFSVHTDIDDPNADLDITASGSFGNTSAFRVQGMVDSIKLKPLNFTTEPMIFRGYIDGDVAHLSPDYLDANILVTRALFVSGTSRLPLDSIQLISGRNDTANFIRLQSDIASAELTGRYRLSDLGYIIQDNIQPYFDVEGKRVSQQIQPYDIRFRADIVYNPVLSTFIPGLEKAETIHAEGQLATGQGLKAVVTSPYILYNGNELTNINVNVNTDASGMHVNGVVGHLKSGNSFDVYNTRINATALNNNISFRLGIDDRSAKNKYFLSGTFSQPTPGTMTIRLNPDSLMLNYQLWTVSPDNSLTITSDAIVANNFTLSKGNQQLSLQSLSGRPAPLQVQFTNFQIGTITGFIKADSTLIDGTTNGTVTFRNLMQQPLFTSDLTITDFRFRQDTVGNVSIQASSSGNSYTTNVTLTGRGNDVQITGTLTPQGTSDIAMNLDVAIRQLELSSVEGALKDFVTSARGGITGNVSVRGTTAVPSVNGKLNFNNATISTVALGGPLTIDGESLSVTNDGFAFNDFTIRDSLNNPLHINGEVLTANFINYEFDLAVDAENFRVINTTKRHNSTYYGEMYVTTSMNIRGTEQSPVIDGALTVNDGTDFTVVVPQQDPAVVSREGVVQFVDFDHPEFDSLFLTAYDSLNMSSMIGYDIATNIEIKKAAKFSIVLDEVNGDFVKLQGDALLSAGIDPSGKITLTGSYEIDQGAYQLTFNFLQRRFDIRRGSKIVWLGEPTTAQLDVTAVYVANTSPLDLVANYISAPTPAIRNTYLQKLPFQVVLQMTGELMKPVIEFDIVLPTDKNYNVAPDIITNVDTRLAQLRQEPSEMNKQVFSLLLLNRFVGENPFESSGGDFSVGNFARQSVSKLLTEQLNNLAENLIDGVDITFDVASTDDWTTGELRNRTDLNVGLSKRLLNDRLTVSVGSNFELEGDRKATNQKSSNFAENIAINYQLSRDGRYMLRMYRKNEYFGVVDGYVMETGVNFIITLDYDKFSQILRRKKQKVENGQRSTETTNQNQTSQ